jgi:hypothetical protein
VPLPTAELAPILRAPAGLALPGVDLHSASTADAVEGSHAGGTYVRPARQKPTDQGQSDRDTRVGGAPTGTFLHGRIIGVSPSTVPF